MKKTRKISTLKNWDKNPRGIKKDDFERLKSQIQKLGQYKPLLITEEGIVLGGNMRLRAYKELGIKEVWVSVVDAPTDKEKTEYALSDNDRAGYYEAESLAELVQGIDIDLDEFKVDLGDAVTLRDVLAELSPDEIEEDEAPPVPEKAESKLGQVYELGRHRLMCGDATKIEDVEKLMDGKKADMVFTDPPYNVDYVGKTKSKLTIENDSLGNNFEQFLHDSLSIMKMFVAGDVYVCMSSSELHTLYSAFARAGGHWSTFLIWVKNHFTMGRSNYQRRYEPILYGWFEKSSHYWSGARNLSDVVRTEDANEDELGNVWLRADDLSMDVWEFDRPSRSREHPTMKPIALCARAIVNSSKKDDIVLDLFLGSASTMVAAHQTNRICFGMELDPRYFDVGIKRMLKLDPDLELKRDGKVIDKKPWEGSP